MSRAAMTDRELRVYKAMLTQQEHRVSGEVARLEAEALRPVTAGCTTDEAPAHEADRQARAGEDAVALSLLGAEEFVLTETRAAMRRLRDGTFGTCERCGRAIGRERLDAIPHARRCVRCERAELRSE